MKTNKLIIYDESCPLCAAYTKGFVATGMIEKENRRNFATIDETLLKIIDAKRSCNEIPVIDIKTKEVWYGIDGLVEILQTKIPFTKKVTGVMPVKWFLYKLYKFISYNRRVVVASKPKTGNFDCSPDFNFRYRLVFLAIFLAFNSIMLLPIHRYILVNSFIDVSLNRFMIAHFLLVASNITIACFLSPEKAFEYLGQINMLALVTILLTIPFILFNKYGLLQYNVVNNTAIVLLILFVFKEYHRRLNFAGIIPAYPVIVLLNITAIAGLVLYLIL